MKIELDILEMDDVVRAALPLCFHAIHTKCVYSREEKSAMELSNARFVSVEMLSRRSPKPISKMPLSRAGGARD